MLQVGLTGGIGGGKSTVSRLLASYGAGVIDADSIARPIVEPGAEGLAPGVGAVGPHVLRPPGPLGPGRLGPAVFADAGQRQRLNAIVPPLIGRETARQQAAAAPDAIVVNDVPLLVEGNLMRLYDVVVVVAAS